ncbi:MAG: lipoate--protein ligase family protein [Candidatus Micrarchaeota archaeon]|nr:lipoate--protein ligase family protein [Candidatus Micrarchaeota archaeon]
MQKSKDLNGARGVFGNREVVYFGYDTLSAARNMAIDHALLLRAGRQERFFLRFYEFERPAVILAAHDHHSVINSSNNGFEVSRRMTGGRPVYVDRSNFEYSIAGPLKEGEALWTSPTTSIHGNLGPLLADAIESTLNNRHEITLGRSSSLRISGKPIAGHGQYIRRGHSFLYHGVVAVDRWDTRNIRNALNVTEEDLKTLETLPNIKDLLGNGKNREMLKEELANNILARIPEKNLSRISSQERDDIMEYAHRLELMKYSNSDWVYRNDGLLRKDMKFCIISQ